MWGVARVRWLRRGEGGGRAPGCGPAGCRRPACTRLRRHGESGCRQRPPVSTRRQEAPRPLVRTWVVLHLGPVPTGVEPPLAPPPPCLRPPVGLPPPQPLPLTACVVRVRSGGPWLAGAAHHHGREDGVLLLEI